MVSTHQHRHTHVYICSHGSQESVSRCWEVLDCGSVDGSGRGCVWPDQGTVRFPLVELKTLWEERA